MPTDYPKHLIPSKDSILLTDEFIEKSHFLGIWVDKDKNLKNDDGKLDVTAIEIHRIPKFSTNKIPNSIESDLEICFIGVNSNYFNYTEWNAGENGVIPAFSDFENITDRQKYFIKYSDIHNFVGVYNNPPDKTENNFNFKLEVIHKPLIANYWHFEFKITNEHGVELKPKGAWQRLICSKIMVRIQDIARFEVPNIPIDFSENELS